MTCEFPVYWQSSLPLSFVRTIKNFSELSHETDDPILITNNGEIDLVFMSQDAFYRWEAWYRMQMKLAIADQQIRIPHAKYSIHFESGSNAYPLHHISARRLEQIKPCWFLLATTTLLLRSNLPQPPRLAVSSLSAKTMDEFRALLRYINAREKI